MAETVIMDPSEETTGRFEVDLTPFIGAAGPDWGEAQIEAYLADAQLGQVPVDFRIPNRTITIPLNVLDADGWTFDELRSALQQKVALWQREGGVLKRQTVIGPVYADIVNASLKLGGSTAQAVFGVDVDASLVLTAIPDWYGEEIDLDTISETTNAEVIRVDTPDRGDHPGRVRIVVTDDEGVPQLGLFWGFRSRHYSSDATAALAYEAEDLTALDAAAIATVTGASGGGSNNVVQHANLGTNWTPVLSTDIDSVGSMTHTGSYRVRARAYTTSATPPRVRLIWDVGDLTNPAPNASLALPGTSTFYLVDLGEVRIDPAPIGTHRWRGQIQAAGAAGGENISIDKVWLQPLDESAGELIAPVSIDLGLHTYTVRDEFNQTSGNLDGKTAAVGGNWDTSHASPLTGADFKVNATDHYAYRDSNDSVPRLAALGSAMTAQVVRADLMIESASFVQRGIVARWVSALNTGVFLAVTAETLDLVVAHDGVDSTRLTTRVPFAIDLAWITLQMAVLANGQFFAWCAPRGGSLGAPIFAGADPACATGGTLEDGLSAVFDAGSSDAVVRAFDNFAAWVPESDAVVFADRSVEVRTDGAYRENSDGAGYGTVADAPGDLPRIPSPGLEGRFVELLVKTSRGDLAAVPDAGIDDVSVRVLYRPSYLYIPDGAPGS